MRKFSALLRRFRRDENGAFGVLFGVLALVLIATAGAVVDFTSIESARTKAQVALDAAALGLQPHVFDTPAKAKSYFTDAAERLVTQRVDNTRFTIDVYDATINSRDGKLELNATVEMPTSFVALIGIPTVRARLVSQATRKRLNLEVAMVLDNSGSMGDPIEASKPKGDSRMTVLKAAATLATDTLFDNQATQPNVYVSVIPFTGYVNVGTANKTASWMSQTGASSVSHLNFDDDDRDDTAYTSTVSRWALYSGFNNKPWAGCVEARIAPYDANDTVPNNAVPDTMFQPVFAPDGPPDDYLSDTGGSCTRRPVVWTWAQSKTACTSNGNGNQSNFDACTSSPAATNSYTQKDVNGATVSPAATTQPANNSVASYYNAATCADVYTSTKTQNSPARYTNVRTRTCTYNFSAVELASRLCKYSGATFTGDGPNSDCPTAAILPLTNVRATVNAKIAAMVDDGSTNIEQGTIWGFHSLSSTEPLTEGRPYAEATSKVMIVMTDGTNNVNYDTYSNSIYGVTGYMAWGYRSNKRLLTESTTPKDSVATSTEVIAETNRRTLLACTAAKDAGVTVYTIGLDSANNATTKTMLQSCATPSKTVAGVTTVYSYFPTTAAALLQVFKDIAAQLSELRLAK